MVYAPGHFRQVNGPARGQHAARRYRSRRERLAVRVMGLIALALVAVAAFSLTSHQRRTANGCIDFSYSTMIGGAEMYRCGGEARAMCASPPSGRSIDTDFETELYAACRTAGLAGRAAGGGGISS